MTPRVAGAVDAHAHVWRRPLAFIPAARHRPDYDARVETCIANLDRNGLAGALLVQPSFLGTDNSQMLAAVARHPSRLRAVVVVDPAIAAEELSALKGQGAVGVRYNLIGLPLPDFTRPPHAGLLPRLRERGWHVEIHREARDLPTLIPPLLAAGVKIAIDHFGRPDPKAPLEDAGFRYLLGLGKQPNVWVKISAAYRCGGDENARAMTGALLDHFDSHRLLWASDWPHTQHEASVTYDSTYALFERTIADASVRRRVLEEACAALF